MGHEASIVRGGLSFHGSLASVYKVNLAHRTASRVLIRLGEFLAQSYPMLYDHTRAIPWEALLGYCLSIGVKATFRSSRLRNKDHIEGVVFEAIDARLKRFGLSAERATPSKLTVYARVREDHCTLSLDTTGQHLHKRGYRLEPSVAPIRETSAAGLLLLAGAGDYDTIVDPFCGSGTIPIEADMLLRDCAPGLRRDFAIECSPIHAAGTLAALRRDLGAKCNTECSKKVLGYDIDPGAIKHAQLCARRAGAAISSFKVTDALQLDFDSLLEDGKRGLIATNLPYGVRIGTAEDTARLLAKLASRLRECTKDWDFAIVAAASASRNFKSLNVAKRVAFQNGGIPVEAFIGSTRDW